MPPPPENPCNEVVLVGTVHDSMLFECASHQFDRLKHHKHHWIEEGTYDDFKECILTSELPLLVTALVGTCSFAAGTGMWRALQGVADPKLFRAFIEELLPDDPAAPGHDMTVALMGTYVTQPADRVVLQGAHYVQMDYAKIERTVVEMLMNRPEVVAHEPKAKASLAAAR